MKVIKVKLLLLFVALSLSSCLNDNTNVALTPITLVATPPNGAIDVRYDTTVVIKATFNVDVNAVTVNNSTFIVKSSKGATLVGTASYSDRVASFTSNNFQPSTTYTASISTGVTSAMGKLSANFEWSFTTAAVPFIPTITSFEPLKGFDGDTIYVVGDNFINPIFSFNGKVAKILGNDAKNARIIVPVGTTTSVLNVKVGSKNSNSSKTFEVVEPKTEIALITKTLLGTWNNVFTSIQSFKGKQPYNIDLSKGFDANSDKFFDSLLYSKYTLQSIEFYIHNDTLRSLKTSTYKDSSIEDNKEGQEYYVSIVLSKKRSYGLNPLTPHAFQIVEKSGSIVSTIYDSYDLINTDMTALLSNILVEKTYQPKIYRIKFKKK
jgi:hypothetical protein